MEVPASVSNKKDVNAMKKFLSVLLAGTILSAALALPAAAADQISTGERVDTWALEPVNRAVQNKLMPQQLVGQDLTEDITRVQFAALAVKLYEAMSGQKTAVPSKNPFKDTSDPEVLKAYDLGIITGISEDTFGPAQLITREEAAVMLTNTYKACTLINKKAYLLWIISQRWENSLNNDTDLTQQQMSNILSGVYYTINGSLDTTGAVPFADDGSISDWASESVYFMSKNKIINGVGNNCFDPQATTQCQAALTMAVQMLEKLE